jgi:2-succinyl-5-enolpyruvyl-6-hydroxy-3-cyclohexene-1-carboxylate synthase
MSNSTVVRYVQLFDQNKYLTYHANRGVSGIDGCSSTAMGYALNSANDNVLITGDMAFFYDSNAFWHNHHPENFKIILINNSGGGIFRIIPGPSSTNQLETYFETQQNMNARSLAELYDLEYDSVSSAEEMQSTIAPFFAKKSKRIKILEVFTPKENNAQVLKEYFEFVHSI